MLRILNLEILQNVKRGLNLFDRMFAGVIPDVIKKKICSNALEMSSMCFETIQNANPDFIRNEVDVLVI